MPTYTNTSSESLTVNGVTFKANETKTSLLILDHPNLTRDSDSPYYNPFGTTYTITGTDTSAVQIINVESEYLRLVPRSGTITIFINSLSGHSIQLDSTITIQNNGRIERVYVYLTGTSELFMQELGEYDFISYE